MDCGLCGFVGSVGFLGRRIGGERGSVDRRRVGWEGRKAGGGLDRRREWMRSMRRWGTGKEVVMQVAVGGAGEEEGKVEVVTAAGRSNESSGLQPTGLSATPRFGISHWGEGLKEDIQRRLPCYLDDWTCGFTMKSVSATLFLFFACFAPVIAFGGLTSVLTNGSLGVVEFIISASASGVAYAIFSGQPLTIIGPTGLTLAFTASLYNFCNIMNIAFLPAYAWTGIWTGLTLMVASIINSSDIIKQCTRFTDDIFNSLIAVTFVYEAGRSLVGKFQAAGADKTQPFMALTIALGTYLLGRFLAEFRKSKYLRRSIRTFLSDFGPCIAIATMSAISCLPFISSIGLEFLTIPAHVVLANGRPLFVDLFAIPVWARFAAALPAALLVCLFFLDQNISVRVVNSPSHKLKKGDAYHLDIMVLGIINFFLSLVGLPWMCAATVQSLNHIRALASVKTTEETGDNSTPREVITGVTETRVTGFMIHALIGSSVLLLPILKLIPMAVISGLFLYLGRNMMTGNEFLRRIKLLFVDPHLYPANSPMRALRPRTVHLYTALQLTCLASLWALKSTPSLSLFFPTVIGLLMVIRSTFAERIFSKSALNALDGDLDYSEETENSHAELYEANAMSALAAESSSQNNIISNAVSGIIADKNKSA